MGICEDCNIKYKLRECCSAHPYSGKSKKLMLDDGKIVRACPNLTSNGICSIYEKRPEICKEHVCHKMNETDLYVILGYDKH